ncbi:MAG: hypothetical protein HY834_10890 [Devosia nanyangense]|uniref:DUF2134 domain-containing protein n=1 Tax=Devosia nanyangense TaxID=1228055 RepID=A0A933L313_9HYPH|nr:hypothetical protein [Devosia nanyangense]
MAIMFAAALALGAVLGAFAIDEGSLYIERRVAQSAVDLASMQAARNPANAYSVARAALGEAGLIARGLAHHDLQNPLSSTRLEVEIGQYVPDSGLSVAARFRANQAPANAVRVRFTRKGTLYFARGWIEPPDIGVEAVAAVTPQVAFSVGSRLASVQGGVANALLNGLLGTDVALSAVTYDNILSAKVGAFGFLDALASELGITVGTYNDLLAVEASRGVIAAALARTLSGAERTAMLTIAAAAGPDGKVTIGKLFDLGLFGGLPIGTGETGAFTELSVLELLALSSAVSDGSHQVALNATADLPGLLGLTMLLSIGEPPQGGTWYAIGPTGTIVRTAQIRLRIVANLKLNLLGFLPIVDVRLPLYLEVANAEAMAQSGTCPAGNAVTGTAVIAARPGVARLVVGDVSDAAMANFGAFPTVNGATIVDVLKLLRVNASADIQIASTQPQQLGFSVADITNEAVKSVRTTTVAQSIATSLVEDLDMKVDLGILAIGLTEGHVRQLLASQLAPLGPMLDGLINTLCEVLGVKLGEADVQVYGVRCPPPVLVR